MKKTAILFTIFFLFLGNISAQESARQRLSSNKSGDNAIALPTRAEQINRSQSVDISNAKWIREIYRYLDLSQSANAPLYYPVMPEEGRMNLFTMIFKLLAEDKIAAYEYLDGREIFSDRYKIKFKDFLDRFGVFHETENGKIVINDVDIPSNEVMGYYLKEAYYFETGTSNSGIKTIAICPVIHRQGDYDATTVRYPLFWISYDDLRPYAQRMPIMTSSLNNTMSGTIDDFFRKHNFNGEIYKTTNPQNLTISQQTSSPEEMKREQVKIEQQLKDFEERLWSQTNDSIPAQTVKQKNRQQNKPAKTATQNSMRDRRY